MALVSLARAPSRIDWRHAVTLPAAVVAVWLLWAGANLAALPFVGTELAGPDDMMRMLQVRELLAGQSWFDVTQYRINPPHGAAMHWSRLIDLPIAGIILLLRPFVAQASAELVAAALVPLLWLLPALFALRAIMLRFAMPPPAIAAALVVLPLFPMLPSNFMPMSVDHHAAQTVAAVLCAALLVHAPSRRAAVACGLVAATWIVISLEGLPLVALLAALYGLRYWLAADRSLGWFLASLTGSTVALTLATRPVSDFSGHCDIVLPGHMAAFAAATAIAVSLRFAPAQHRPAARLAALTAIPLVCAPLAVATLGRCATDPYGALDPLLKTYWYDFVSEGLPVWLQVPSLAVTLVWMLPLVGLGWWVARRNNWIARERELDWALLALLALGGWAYSLGVMREGLVAEMLAIPFAAVLLADLLPRAQSLQSPLTRIAATLGVAALVLPTVASAVLHSADRVVVRSAVGPATLASVNQGEKCDYARLAALPKGLVFATIDRGPTILWETPHAVVAGGYHRNQAPMLEVIRAFTGDPARAEAIVRATGANYVVACSSEKDLAVFRDVRPDNLANALVDGHAPSWLVPLPNFTTGSLRVYRPS